MAEPSTIARPYAAALFRSCNAAESAQFVPQLDALAALTHDAGLRQFAANPKVGEDQVFALVSELTGTALPDKLRNLLLTVIENDRLTVLPEIASQFRALVNETGGVSDARIVSAYPMDAGQQASLVAVLEHRFGRRLNAEVEVDASLIGGVRVTVGDQVLDTSVRARLEQMRVALTH